LLGRRSGEITRVHGQTIGRSWLTADRRLPLCADTEWLQPRHTASDGVVPCWFLRGLPSACVGWDLRRQSVAGNLRAIRQPPARRTITRLSAIVLAGFAMLLIGLVRWETKLPVPVYVPTPPTVAPPFVIPPAPTPPAPTSVAPAPLFPTPQVRPTRVQPTIGVNPAAFAFNRGVSCLERDDWEVAIVCFTEAIRLKPGHVAAYERRAHAYSKLGDQAKAEADLARASKLRAKKSLLGRLQRRFFPVLSP